jgi:acid stress-induced BolA-like protein IbaG/YrbA
MNPQIIKQLIESGLPGADIIVEGDDGTHFQARIVSELFAGKSMIQQHQMVYKTLGDKMGTEIHALSIKTSTPDELEK